MICEKCGRNIDEGSRCPFCENDAKAFGQEHKIPIYGVSMPYTMKWYKFLIYFSLIFTSVSCGVDGLSYLFGMYWKQLAAIDPSFENIYSAHRALRYVDFFMGVVQLAVAGYCIYVRSALMEFKKSAPVMLYVLYGLNQLVQICYLVAAGIEGVIQIDYFQISGSIIGTAIAIWLNMKYFKKRAGMFVG